MNDILFGNNNKAVIKKLANRSFRSNKMRNVIAAIAIALTTFLFTAVLTIGMGASGTLEYSMAKMMGSSADALVQGLSEDQLQQLKENAMFEKVGCWIPVEIMTNTNRRVAEVDYADQTQLEIRMLTPRTGSAPQKANEVLVSANILKDLNIEEKIGAEIPVELKVRQSGQVYHFDTPTLGMTQKNQPKIKYTLDFDVTPHQLRHTYITNLLYAGVDPKTVQYLAGHENSKTTMDIYAKVKYNKPEELFGVVNGAFHQPVAE